MQQRVGLARALASEADVLLMDEAFSALDPLIRREMQDQLLELQARLGKTIVFITHDLNEAMRLGDRIAIMRDGRIVQLGTPEQILADPGDEYVERFVADVDRSRVFTASDVMVPAATVLPGSPPAAALEALRSHGGSALAVVDGDGRLVGVVTGADLLAASGNVTAAVRPPRRPRCPGHVTGRAAGPCRGERRPRRRRGRRRPPRGLSTPGRCCRRWPVRRPRDASGPISAPSCWRAPVAEPTAVLAAEESSLPRVPVGEWVDTAFDWLKDNFDPVFDAIATGTEAAVEGVTDALLVLPPLLFAAILAALAVFVRSVVFAIGSLVGLLLIQSMELWEPAMQTLALVLVATLVAIVVAIPVGIAAAKSSRVSGFVRPVLDLMQTMPAFVYLIPAVTFFSIGLVPGVVTTIIFALPPGVRLTELGIRQVDREIVEAGHAFGARRGRSCAASSSRWPGRRSWPASTR